MVAPVFRELYCLGGVVLLPIVGVPTALAGKGLVIPIEPCSRGSPPYSLQEFVAEWSWWRLVHFAFPAV
ncbi:hypothetical protein Taro_031645 [Colocasia esculenta]|uniref:Uncharacterized protein n=1 Tax=Colocasia esculenta TaxID=4460 RepID=A0A843W3R6_COLES|nr:hypothetical protein [Colocasia esculenta]